MSNPSDSVTAPRDDQVATVVSRFLEAESEAIVGRWIDWLKAHVPTRTVSALPERALRNHVPPALESLGRYVRNPVEIVRRELISHLRLHGQIRRDQGYSLKEVLAEFEGLADIVSNEVSELLRNEVSNAEAWELLAVSNRLAAGLRSISYIAMGTYADSEEERQRAVAKGLEEFGKTVFHELRSPLNALALGLEVLKNRAVRGDDLEDQFHSLEKTIRQTGDLLDTVHALAVTEGAQAQSKVVQLDYAINDVLRQLAERPGAVIETRIDEPLPEVWVEAILAYIVLVNVIGNATKYADPEKDESRISISASIESEEHDSGFCRILIEDNGLGIPAELLPRICQKGFRAHPEHAEGAGLGLYLAQRALMDRGGTLTIESEEGQGTRVVAKMRCLEGSASALSADRFSVEYLMGKSALGKLSEART